ncbi:MAG: RNA pseudouridine synthase [Bacteroidota bacterium]
MTIAIGNIGDHILYKNNQLLAFNKPPALPVQADKTGDKSLLELAEIYCQSRLHLIHRLDRPASGLVLLAKNPKALAHLNAQFRDRSIHKTYLALVQQAPPQPAGELKHYLHKDGRSNRSTVSAEARSGSKLATLRYRLLGSLDRYHLLEIDLLSGRHHQIRAQLAAIGCPIKGDVKYGFRRSNRDRSIHLHAWKLAFEHPVSGERVELCAPAPVDPLWQACEDFLTARS